MSGLACVSKLGSSLYISVHKGFALPDAIGKSEQGLRRRFLNKPVCAIFRALYLICSLNSGWESRD